MKCPSAAILYIFFFCGVSCAFVPKLVVKHRQHSPSTATVSTTAKSTARLVSNQEQHVKSLEWRKPSEKQVFRWRRRYGEVSRVYRRDVFDPEDWIRSRRPTRFIESALTAHKSGLIRSISLHVNVLAAFTTFVIVYNNLWLAQRLPFRLHDILPSLRMPILPFNLAAGSLGLLLTFRTNSCYQRWNEARSAWGKMINDSRSLARTACIWGRAYSGSPDLPELLNQLGDAICSVSRSVMNRTLPKAEDETNFVKYCSRICNQDYATRLYNAAHRPTRALAEVSDILVQLRLDPLYQIQIEQMATELCSAFGVCERILTSPIPIFYSRHTSRFLAAWLFALPMALYDSIVGWKHFALVPVMVALGVFMFGIEELSVQMEEPFSILPMEKMCENSIRGPVMAQVNRSNGRDEKEKLTTYPVINGISS